ncbi:hypothetical protein LK996_09305 [Lysobacter sp. A6]|uniref:RelA/SpoT domain-containing protein n=1 Tax=Noviluteimonas lactosilytica TaxID=2888523 RepID=A0ABS8JIC9_9GAMM|nr:hypothetical protein [Lysobacter lactosilyticus]MCC8363270.1 hypothetical protein [Lysobacter lactosilyticus]
MIIPPAVERKHAFVQAYVEQVGARVRDIVSNFCEDSGYAFLGRVKGVASLAEKLEGGRYKQWSDVDDLYACAVIIPTLSDEPSVLAFLRDRFTEQATRARATSKKDPDVFRFDSTRFVGSLRDDVGISGPLTSVQFEVQIRSAFEHAWSVSTHALAYKGGNVGWRHKRLAAQLRASIEQLDQVVLGFQEWTGLIQEQRWHYVDDQRALVEGFESWVADGSIPQEIAPESWVRFGENLYSLISATMKSDREHGHVKNVEHLLAAIAKELEDFSGNKFPRSISLLQFCIGVMFKAGLATETRAKYCALVTDELRSLYPDVSKAKFSVFDFEFETA